MGDCEICTSPAIGAIRNQATGEKTWLCGPCVLFAADAPGISETARKRLVELAARGVVDA